MAQQPSRASCLCEPRHGLVRSRHQLLGHSPAGLDGPGAPHQGAERHGRTGAHPASVNPPQGGCRTEDAAGKLAGMIARTLNRLVFPLLLLATAACAQTASPHLFFRVTLGTGMTGPVSGRVLIFLEAGSGAKAVQGNEFQPSATSIAGKEVADLQPGASIDIDVDNV